MYCCYLLSFWLLLILQISTTMQASTPTSPQHHSNKLHKVPSSNSLKNRTFHNFRPILHRSMSAVSRNASSNGLASQDSGADLSMLGGLSSKRASLYSQASLSYDPTSYYFYKFGSSFGKLPVLGMLKDGEHPLIFSVAQLQAVLAIVSIFYGYLIVNNS